MLTLFCRRRRRGDERRCCCRGERRAGDAGGEKKRRRRSGWWRNSSMDDAFHLFRSRGEDDEIPYFREWKRPSSSYEDTSDCRHSTTFAIIILPGRGAGRKIVGIKHMSLNEYQTVRKDSSPRGCNFLLVRVLTLYRAPGDHPFGG